MYSTISTCTIKSLNSIIRKTATDTDCSVARRPVFHGAQMTNSNICLSILQGLLVQFLVSGTGLLDWPGWLCQWGHLDLAALLPRRQLHILGFWRAQLRREWGLWLTGVCLKCLCSCVLFFTLKNVLFSMQVAVLLGTMAIAMWSRFMTESQTTPCAKLTMFELVLCFKN